MSVIIRSPVSNPKVSNGDFLKEMNTSFVSTYVDDLRVYFPVVYSNHLMEVHHYLRLFVDVMKYASDIMKLDVTNTHRLKLYTIFSKHKKTL